MKSDVFNIPAPILDEALAEAKELRLKETLATYPSLAVAYSGGVDSAYLSAVAHEVLAEKCRMILADSPSLPRSEFKEASELATSRNWNFLVIETDEFQNENYLKNDGKRCYFCRSSLFSKMKEYADSHAVEVMAYGAMADDAFDPTRLGTLAANEYEIVAPLQLVELGKLEIRYLSEKRALPTADKAAFACLSSRFPKGTRVTLDALAQVEAAEEILKSHGFHQYRARHHGERCHIEVGADETNRLQNAPLFATIEHAILELGYAELSFDPKGYRDPNQPL
jgi:pyridinium-3,5-biscarboxylic acid mononucleotide sulfurtransferase